jgi:teichuronic acid exporter
VETLFSAKWLPCVPYFQWLCVMGLLFPLHLVNVNILRARGEMNVFLKLELIKKILIAVAILITWRWGIMAMVWGQVVQSAINFFLNAYYGGRGIRYCWAQQLRDVLPYAGLTVLMVVVSGAAGFIPLRSPLAFLLVQTSAGAGVYIGVCYALQMGEFIEVYAWVANRAGIARTKLGFARPLET